MTTQTHTPVVATRGRRTLGGARPGSTVPTHIAMRLRGVTDGAEQLGAIAHHTLPELIGKIAWQVGHAKAEDLAMDVIERHLTEHRKNPRDSYHHVDEYHRLRASLIRSTVNASIDHLRRKSTRVEMSVGSFFDDGDHDMAVAGGDLPIDECDEALHRHLDAAALYDGLRRVDARDAELLRMKLDGATFTELADHLGVRSKNAAFKQYQRALSAAQTILERYGAGGYCAEYGASLLLLRQEAAATDDGAERPLTDMVGTDRAREIRLHVYGDPAIASDDGCAGCRNAGREHEVILGSFLPPPLLLIPAAGLLAAVKGAVGGAWSGLTSWLGGLFGGGGGAAAGAGVAAKCTAVIAATAVAVGGSVTVRNAVHRSPPKPVPAKVSAMTPAPAVVFTPRRTTRPRTSTATTKASAATPARITTRAGSPAAEFTPTPRSRTSAPRKRSPRAAAGGNAAAEFAPGP